MFLTHVHADHDGGLIEKLLSGSRTTVIASDPVFRAFAEKAQLVTGHDFEREGLVRHVSANPDSRVRIEVAGEFAELETRWNMHPIPTNGLKVTVDWYRDNPWWWEPIRSGAYREYYERHYGRALG